MSCAYSVYCRTCNVEGGVEDINHGDDVCLKAIQGREAFAVLHELLTTEPYKELDGQFEIGACYRIRLSFFAVHRGHDLAVRDEYGAFLDECSARFKCEGCGDYAYCRLAKGHDGAHDKRKKK